MDQISKYPNEKIVVITTGSQGEPMSALARMAASEHRKINVIPGDTVIISATPIPGNEKFVSKVINQLFKRVLKLYMILRKRFTFQVMHVKKNLN